MRESDVRRLKARYSSVDPNVSNDRRLNEELDLGIGSIIDLGDLLLGDLDASNYGIGWWSAYTALSRKARISISDYLVASARDVATNLLEAYVYRLEFDHALVDFEEYVRRGFVRTRLSSRRRVACMTTFHISGSVPTSLACYVPSDQHWIALAAASSEQGDYRPNL